MGQMVVPQPTLKRIEQKTTATCWLAACKMLYAWKGKSTTDVDDLLKKASATDELVDYDYWIENGIGHSNAVPLARTLGFTWGSGGKLDLDDLVNVVRAWGPMIALGQWNNPHGAHAIVVAEVEDSVGTKYESIAKVMIANPWFYCDERETRSVSWLNGGLGDWEGVNGQYIHWGKGS
jgi:hypothetical protein